MDKKIILNIDELSDWNFTYHNKLIISGPCSAETESQLLQTASELVKYGVNVLRAGIWKPRTRPGFFEGVGNKGLHWLKKVKKSVSLPIAVEVATPDHVEACLKYGIDILWIGTRTTVNPFYVQSIADALKGIDIPVMVKNPINPDIDLWIGALERLNKAGVRKLAAIHRGFSVYKRSLYRNQPNWQIPIELKRRFPNLPILCDPSHICGNRELIWSVSQKAMDLLFDGLMIESHCSPASALSDAKQQITPEQLGELIHHLKFKLQHSNNKMFQLRISEMRKWIDEIDQQVIDLLAKRMKIANAIGKKKKQENLSVFQPDRWSKMLTARLQAGTERKLSKQFIAQIFEFIHEESIHQQS